MKIKTFSFLSLFGCLLWMGVASALTVLSLNLAQLSELADDIFVGKIQSVEEAWDPDGRPVIDVSVQVLEVIKGDASNVYQFTQLRSLKQNEIKKNQVTMISSMPSYTVGQELVLFMSRPSEIGLSAPIGIFQGTFNIKTSNEDGKKYIVNSYQNKNLFLKMKKSTSSKGPQALSVKEKSLVRKTSPGKIEYSTFLSIVRKLVP